jgi:hypothetical protein
MLRILPLMQHLPPPTRWGPIRISRYSPYHNEPDKFGIKGLRAWQGYYELFGDFADRIALHFFGEYTTEFQETPDLVDRLDQAVIEWTDAWKDPNGPPTLSLRRFGSGWMEITDTRAVARTALRILPPHFARVLDSVQLVVSQRRVPAEDREILDHLVELGYVMLHEQRYLSLVTEPELGETLLAQRSRNLGRRVNDPTIEIPLDDVHFGPERRKLALSHSETLRI